MNKLKLVIIVTLTCCTVYCSAQQVGISFSYFLPKNGYFSTPISPFSIRGVGVGLGDYMAIQTGFSLYRMSGMNVIDMGNLATKDPVIGPNFTLLIPVEFVLQYSIKKQEFKVKGGGFAFQTFDNRFMYGNIDKAIRRMEGWEVANADFEFDNNIGYGYFFGVEYIVYVTRQWGLSFEVNYFIGGADFPIEGSYTGGNFIGGLDTKLVNYEDARLDFTGLEISLGILITN